MLFLFYSLTHASARAHTHAHTQGESDIAEEDAAALLEGCALLLASLADVLLSDDNKAFCDRLVDSAVSVRTAVCHSYGNVSRAAQAAEQIQCYIPATPAQTKTATAALNALDDGAVESSYAPIVDRWVHLKRALLFSHTLGHACVRARAPHIHAHIHAHT